MMIPEADKERSTLGLQLQIAFALNYYMLYC